MSSTLPILMAVKDHLKAHLTDWEIELMPDKLDDYFLTHPNGAVLISYVASRFGGLRAADIVSQTRTVNIVLTVITRNLHNDYGALDLLDRLRLLIVGFKPPDCTECYLIEEHFEGEDTGTWQYQLILQTETVQLQNVECKDLPKLVEVIKRRKGQPLDPRLTKK